MAILQLDIAKKAKADEFYTQLVDVENELIYYKGQFKDKVVYCNCDNPHESNFFKYFVMNFNNLGIQKLIATNYKRQYAEEAYKAEIVEVDNVPIFEIEGIFKNPKNKLTKLKGDGDFRSDECVELLKEADMVVTNPPFSLFREYVAQLMKYNKKFLIIGNLNARTYKEIFPLIKDNKIWSGYFYGCMKFKVPDYYEPRATAYCVDENGQRWRSLGNICWYTNLDVPTRHKNITLYKKYNPKEYPKYDNYDAIEVSKVANIPYDYEGVMGVPITFIDKYNPEQFEIVKFRKGNDEKDLSINGKYTYYRILIRRIGKAQ